jgi:hypothetical protein
MKSAKFRDKDSIEGNGVVNIYLDQEDMDMNDERDMDFSDSDNDRDLDFDSSSDDIERASHYVLDDSCYGTNDD